MSIETELREVMALAAKVKAAQPLRVYEDQEFGCYGVAQPVGTKGGEGFVPECFCVDDASLIAGSINFLRKHGPELLRKLAELEACRADGERLIKSRMTRCVDCCEPTGINAVCEICANHRCESVLQPHSGAQN